MECPSPPGAWTSPALPAATVAEGASPAKDAGKAPGRQPEELRIWCWAENCSPGLCFQHISATLPLPPFTLLALVPLGSKGPQRPAWWGPSVSSPSMGQAERLCEGTSPWPTTAHSRLPLGLPASLSSTQSDFASLSGLIKVVLHSSLASMWSFPLWTLSKLPKQRGVVLWWKGVRAQGHPCSFREDWGVGTCRSGSTFGHHPSELRKTFLAALLPVTIRPCPAVSLPTNAQQGRRP